MTEEIIRISGRNEIKRIWDGTQTLFVKRGVAQSSDPSREFVFWKCFKAVAPECFPDCVYSDPASKTIAYCWLDGYRDLRKSYDAAALQSVFLFLEINGKVNRFDVLKSDLELVAESRRRRDSQRLFYADSCMKALGLSRTICGEDVFCSALERALEDFSSEEVLCHGDLGRSNILVNADNIKIVDYEYSMFSCLETDYGRILASSAISETIPSSFQCFEREARRLCDMNSTLSFDRLSHMTGLQMLMRYYGCSKEFSIIPANIVLAVKLLVY